MSSADGLPSGLICTNCKLPVPANSTYCPFCGQLSPQTSGFYTAASSEANTQESWPNLPPGSFQQDTTENVPPPAMPPVYGVSAAAIPFIAGSVPVPVKKKGGTGRLITSISVALLVALVLGIGGYTLYNVFAAHDESAAAGVVPGNTLAYASIDIVQYASNSHNFSINNLFQSSAQAQNDPIKQATGLDWQNDILPWVDRDIAVVAFERPSASAGNSNPLAQIGEAILIQSKDNSAAQKAMKKAADFQGSQGHTVNQSSYSGFTLYSVDTGSNATFTAGSGWAIIASDMGAAKTIIDRINGKGDTLADSQLYQNATSNLPSDRFGTIFVNIKELMQLYSSAAGTTGNETNQLMPLANTYPTAGGFLEWNSAGLRAQVTLRAAENLGIGDLHGNTTALASLVPQSATLYAGFGNLGAEALAASKISNKLGNAGTTADPLQSLLGVNSSDPVLQQPAALVVAGGTGIASAVPGIAFLLKAPNAAAAQALLQRIAAAHQFTIQSMTVAGQSAMGMYSASGMQVPFIGGTTCSNCFQPANSPTLVAVATQVNGALVVGSSSAVVATIINTANSGQSLAEQSNFRQLTQNAPSDAASSLFVNLSSLESTFNGLGQDGSIGKLLAHTTALLITSSSNDQQIQTTVDLKVNI